MGEIITKADFDKTKIRAKEVIDSCESFILISKGSDGKANVQSTGDANELGAAIASIIVAYPTIGNLFTRALALVQRIP